MSKNLKYIQLYSDEHKNTIFNTDTLINHYNIVRLLNYNLSHFFAAGIERINIMLTSDLKEDLNTSRFGNVLDVHFYFNQIISDREKILEQYENVFLKLKDKNNWEVDIAELLEGVKRMDFKVEDYFSRSIWNNDKTLYYKLFFCEEGLDKISLYLHLFDKGNKIPKKIIFNVVSCGIVIKDVLSLYVGKHGWEDSEIIIYHSNKKDYWEIKIEGEVNFHFQRAEKGDPHGEYDLGIMLLTGKGVLENKVEGLKWLRKSAEKNYIKAVNALKKF